MLTSGISNTYWCHSVGEPCNFVDSLCFNFSFGRCYCQWFWATWCYWQMLLSCCICVCNWCFCFGWCYSQLLCFLYGRWWCYCHLVGVFIGRCYCHLFLWLLVLPLDHQIKTLTQWLIHLPPWLQHLPSTPMVGIPSATRQQHLP